MEKKEAYSEAIEVWKEIQQLEPENAEAHQSLERLTLKVSQKSDLKKMLQQLTIRMKEIKPVYMAVAMKLRRVEKKGIDEEGEILISIIENFLKQELSADEFIEIWQQGTPPQPDIPNYDTLAKRLNRGELIPMLGSEVLHLSGFVSPVSQIVAQKLAERSEYFDSHVSLPLISHYYQMKNGRDDLISTVKDVVEPDSGTFISNPLYQVLAGARDPLLIISTFYDSQLEKAFSAKEKPCVVISHLNDIRKKSDYGKILIKYSEKPVPEEPCTAEELSGLKLLDKGYSIIYKICGCLGFYGSGSSEKRDSFMLSEEDFFTFARHLEKIIPPYLAQRFSEKSLIFLGYDLDEWNNRLIAHAIMEKRQASREFSYGVKENPTPYEKVYLKLNGVEIYQIDLKEFIDNLAQSMETER
jgi:hypothetical protein